VPQLSFDATKLYLEINDCAGRSDPPQLKRIRGHGRLPRLGRVSPNFVTFFTEFRDELQER